MNDASSATPPVQLFKVKFRDFVDFEHPGAAFEENENHCKRDILASWQAENAPMRLWELTEARSVPVTLKRVVSLTTTERGGDGEAIDTNEREPGTYALIFAEIGSPSGL